MKTKLISILTVTLVLISLAAPFSQALADTSVQIATNSGATYLTTTTVSTTSSTVTPVGTPVPTVVGPVFLPSGFFPNATVLVNQIFRIIMVIAVILVFAYLVLGGIQYITSGGEKGKTEAARNKIISAIIGLIIVASSYAILTIVLNFIGYRDVSGLLNATPVVVVTPVPTPSPTPTPTSVIQKLLQ